MTRTIRTALDRANDDLAAAQKRLTKATAREQKARQEASAAKAEKDAAATEVETYRDLVRKLGGEPKAAGVSRAGNSANGGNEPTP